MDEKNDNVSAFIENNILALLYITKQNKCATKQNA